MTYLDDVRWEKKVEEAHPPLLYEHFVSAVLFDLSGIANSLDVVPRLARIVATCQIAIRKWDDEAFIDPDGSELTGTPSVYQLLWLFTRNDDPVVDPNFDDWYALGCGAAQWLYVAIRDGVSR